jgi:hypothetical protein
MDHQMKLKNDQNYIYKYLLYFGNYNNNMHLINSKNDILFLTINENKIIINTFDNIDCDELCYPLYINNGHFEQVNSKIKYFIHHFADITESIKIFNKFMEITINNIIIKIKQMNNNNITMESYRLTEDIYIYYQLYRVLFEYISKINRVECINNYQVLINNILFKRLFTDFDRLNGYPNDLIVLDIAYKLLDMYHSCDISYITPKYNRLIIKNLKETSDIYDYYEELSELSELTEISDINIKDIIDAL